MISRKLLWQTCSLLLIASIVTGCAGIAGKLATATPPSQTGGITGMMIDANGKSLVGIEDTGYVVLYCADDSPGVECLHEGYEHMDSSTLLASICDITDWSDQCRVHLGTSAAKIGWNGKYIIPVVRPGQYDLIVIVVYGGVMAIMHLLHVDPVEAGKVTTYDFPTK